MKKSGVLVRDEERFNDYNIIKPLFDELHDRFIRDSLSEVQIEKWWVEFLFYKAYKNKVKDLNKKIKDKGISKKEKEKLYREKDKLEKDLWKHLTDLRKKVCKLYTTTAKVWKEKEERQEKNKKDENVTLVKKEWYHILLESGVLKVLKKIYNKDENIAYLIENNVVSMEMLQKKYEDLINEVIKSIDECDDEDTKKELQRSVG